MQSRPGDEDFADIGVLIAERLAFFRRGMAGLLQESRPGWRLAEAACFEDALAHLLGQRPDMLLLDLLLPGMDGVAGLRRLRALRPGTSIVVLADIDERETILRCLAAGAQGYVLKSASPYQFQNALDTILSGGVFAPASLSGGLDRTPTDASSAPAPRPPAMLTDRQRDVFALMSEGCATKIIAQRLGLSVGTVKVHLAAIYRLLDAHSRTEAMAKARGETAPPKPPATETVRTAERVN